MIGCVPLPIVGSMNIPFALPGCSAKSLPEDGSDRLVIQVLRDEASAQCPRLRAHEPLRQ